jgi:hypothetical protein
MYHSLVQNATPKPALGRMALGALILLSFRLEAPAKGIRRESKHLNPLRDIRPTASQPFPLPSNEWEGGLVRDKLAPPSFPTSWGLFTINEKQGSETLHGHVKLIGWRASDARAALDELMPEQQQPQQGDKNRKLIAPVRSLRVTCFL